MDAAFWNFSLTVYRQHGVQEECLHLQDQFGVDVNLLLFCAFMGAVHGAVLPVSEIAEAEQIVHMWQSGVVGVLRAARRELKPYGARQDWPFANAAEALRAKVKAAELESERFEQAILAGWASGRLEAWPRQPPQIAISANIHALLSRNRHTVQTVPEAPSQLVAASLSPSSFP